ncbi:heptaprenyl diphosphate synthase component II [Fictibacillus sp. Mic-4]|uniref:heptaprenyl diphosphate synthase component II n=1 Tax=Fictibacillus TaxID=1329200 RepID=UPI00047E78AA|nr:heptaprenyl diphosphate synthase component II [Fictibacillus gelatini]
MKLTDLYRHIKKDLQLIENELELSVSAEHPILEDAGRQLLKAGGKRIRPVFVLLSAHFGDYNIEIVKRVAVALELIHMASLVHDDVIDDADLRRGEKTVKSMYDNKVAMYTGDFMFARALEQITHIQIPRAHQILAHCFKEMCIGEIQQIKEQYDLNQHFRHYLRRIKRKTALLIAMSCQLGAISTNAPLNYQRELFNFGYSVGMAYQITDDILDFTGTEKQLGKPAGGDLKQGNITLPVLHTMKNRPEIVDEIKQYYKTFDDRTLQRLIQEIKENGSVEYASNIANVYLDRAFLAVNKLPGGQAKTSLIKIAKYIGKRKF